MTANEAQFHEFKIRSLEKLHDALENSKVDTKVIPILTLVNTHECYVTTSSCAGRIVLMQLPEVGNKKQAVFLGVWHREILLSEIKEALKRYESGQLWFLAQSPIFHIAAKTIKDADELVRKGISAGFKHSGFKTAHTHVIVELVSTERMDVPLGVNNQYYGSDEYLSMIVDMGNNLLKRSQKKLIRIQKILEETKE